MPLDHDWVRAEDTTFLGAGAKNREPRDWSGGFAPQCTKTRLVDGEITGVFGDRYPSQARKSAESRLDWASRRSEPEAWPRSVSRAVLHCAAALRCISVLRQASATADLMQIITACHHRWIWAETSNANTPAENENSLASISIETKDVFIPSSAH